MISSSLLSSSNTTSFNERRREKSAKICHKLVLEEQTQPHNIHTDLVCLGTNGTHIDHICLERDINFFNLKAKLGLIQCIDFYEF